MNYLLFIGGGLGEVGLEERAAALDQLDTWVSETERSGVRILGRPLELPDTSTTVRVRDGETLLSDGPFAEAKEWIGGFDLIEAADLDEALAVTARHPIARYSKIELRPLHDGLQVTDAVREWGARQPPDSWVLFFCLDGIPKADVVEARVAREAEQWGARQRERGTLIFGHALRHVDTATTVRVRDGETLLTDGPFVESKEFIGGLAVLCGVTREEAIAIASEHPVAAFHRVEVRRFMEG